MQIADMENRRISPGLKRSLSDYQRPPLPPKKLGRSPSGEIANKVKQFEQLAKEGSPPKDDNINKGKLIVSSMHSGP